jgi:hypothetical protein
MNRQRLGTSNSLLLLQSRFDPNELSIILNGVTQELYAFTSNRSAEFVLRLLDKALPQRMPVAQDYPVPESSDHPTQIFKSDLEILCHLERHSEEPYGIYWNDASAGSRLQAMAFYTRDGGLIFGIAGNFPDPESSLKALGSLVGAKFMRFGWEQRPPDTASEFIAQCSGSR